MKKKLSKVGKILNPVRAIGCLTIVGVVGVILYTHNKLIK